MSRYIDADWMVELLNRYKNAIYSIEDDETSKKICELVRKTIQSCAEIVEDIPTTRVEIPGEMAFRLLIKSLNAEFVCDEDTDYFVRNAENGEPAVYAMYDGHEKLVDDRGALFIALRNVAVCMFPNTGFRSADYIYGADVEPARQEGGI